MALVFTDIKLFESLDTNSLGGDISSTPVSSVLNAFYSDVDFDEADVGSIKYRCLFVKNDSGTDTLTNTTMYIAATTPSPSTSIEIGVDSAVPKNTPASSIATEDIPPPVTVTFGAFTPGAPLSVGTLDAGDYRAVWIKRTVLANAVGEPNDNVVLGVSGDEGP